MVSILIRIDFYPDLDTLVGVEQDRSRALQTTFSGADIVSSGIDVVRQGPKQRALGILHQIIEDAHNGKRQFLSGKYSPGT